MKKIHRHLKNGKEKIKRALTKGTDEVKQKLKHVPHGMIAYAKKNPLKIVGLSVLAGVILSQLTRFRR